MDKEFFLQLLELLSAMQNYGLVANNRLKPHMMNDGICVNEINIDIDCRYERWRALSEKLLLKIKSSEQMKFIYTFLHPGVQSQAGDLWEQLTVAEFEVADSWEKITHALINSGPEIWELLWWLDLASNCIAGFLERKGIFSNESFIELQKKLITEAEQNGNERGFETNRIKAVIKVLKILVEIDPQFV
ncbi:MAG TPA: hypothetical protein PKL13_03225 [bacterium]|nr:hypothetical protein [bacterium]